MVVIKYVPYVGDSKRAMDEYSAEIFMGGCQTIVMHNTCEDSLLAAPIILDLVLLAGKPRCWSSFFFSSTGEERVDGVHLFPSDQSTSSIQPNTA